MADIRILSGDDGAVLCRQNVGPYFGTVRRMTFGPVFDDREDAEGFVTWLKDHHNQEPHRVRDHEWASRWADWRQERSWPFCQTDDCPCRVKPGTGLCDDCMCDVEFEKNS